MIMTDGHVTAWGTTLNLQQGALLHAGCAQKRKCTLQRAICFSLTRWMVAEQLIAFSAVLTINSSCLTARVMQSDPLPSSNDPPKQEYRYILPFAGHQTNTDKCNRALKWCERCPRTDSQFVLIDGYQSAGCRKWLDYLSVNCVE